MKTCAKPRLARWIGATVLLVAFAFPSWAQDFIQTDILSDLETGLICPSGQAEEVPAPDTMLGFIKRREDWQRIVYRTTTVPLIRNLGFGIDVAPIGPRNLDPVTIRITHPPYKDTDVTEESWSADLSPERSNLNFFVFEFRHEMVLGTWTFEIEYAGEIILRQSFDVVHPSRYPGVDGLCDGELLAQAGFRKAH